MRDNTISIKHFAKLIVSIRRWIKGDTRPQFAQKRRPEKAAI
nr:MAG TPA: hypothetical protein [Caudoviricetes sp.]